VSVNSLAPIPEGDCVETESGGATRGKGLSESLMNEGNRVVCREDEDDNWVKKEKRSRGKKKSGLPFHEGGGGSYSKAKSKGETISRA